jgi:hypothetical protein
MGTGFSVEWKSDGENSNKFTAGTVIIDAGGGESDIRQVQTLKGQKDLILLPAGSYRVTSAKGRSDSNDRNVTVMLGEFNSDFDHIRSIVPIYTEEGFGYWGSTFQVTQGTSSSTSFVLLKDTLVRPVFSNAYTSYKTMCSISFIKWQKQNEGVTKNMKTAFAFWTKFNASRKFGKDYSEDFDHTSKLVADRVPWTDALVNVDKWTAPHDGVVMVYFKKGNPAPGAEPGSTLFDALDSIGEAAGELFGSMGAVIEEALDVEKKTGDENEEDYHFQVNYIAKGFEISPGSKKNLVCYTASSGSFEVDDINEGNKLKRARMTLAAILRTEDKGFTLFTGQEEKLYRLLSRHLMFFEQGGGDIRAQYTNANITDWSVKANRLVALDVKRKVDVIEEEYKEFTDEVWHAVIGTLMQELSNVEVVRNLFLVLDDLETKLQEQRHNDMDHVIARLNLSKGTAFKYHKEVNEEVWDEAGIYAVAASVIGSIPGAQQAFISGSLWLLSTLSAYTDDGEPELDDPFTRQTDYTFLDFEKLVDKSMKQARSYQRLQHRILSDPEKIKIVSRLVVSDFRIDVGQTAVIAEYTKVPNRTRFYQMLMPQKYCIRHIGETELFAIRGLDKDSIRKAGILKDPASGAKLFLSMIDATPTRGTITEGTLIAELTAPIALDGSGLGVDRLDFFRRRGFWSSMQLTGVTQILS